MHYGHRRLAAREAIAVPSIVQRSTAVSAKIANLGNQEAVKLCNAVALRSAPKSSWNNFACPLTVAATSVFARSYRTRQPVKMLPWLPLQGKFCPESVCQPGYKQANIKGQGPGAATTANAYDVYGN